MSKHTVFPSQPVGRMTSEETDQFGAWLSERIGDHPKCPMCEHTEWVMGDVIALLAAGPLGGINYPVVGLVCKNCGNTMLFNAIVMGIGDRQVMPEEDSDADEK